MEKRTITIHHDRIVFGNPSNPHTLPIESQEGAKRIAALVAKGLAASWLFQDDWHFEVVLAPSSLIKCCACGIQYDAAAWHTATYYEHQYNDRVVVEVRRCACGVDLTPDSTILQANPTSN